MAEMLKEVGSRYKVLATLGEGGMGVVYLVEDTTNGAQVALKVLSGQMGMDANQVLQFKQEFRVMAKLKHPNTCGVYDYGLLPDGTPYFTMEVVPGKGLDELIPLAPDALTQILSQISQALGYIHQQGYVHCDIKPENIRLKPDGTVKLMDFGLMEVSGKSGGAIKGTLAYMAPEVAKRDLIDPRSDIYSLGAVTYQLLTGQAPFKGATPIEVLRAHLNQQPRPLREINSAIPALLEQVILKMLAKEPVSRYQSIFDVLAAMGIALDSGVAASLLASAFVGRQAEIQTLQQALTGIQRERKGRTLLLSGAAGVGKSRLLGEFRFVVQLAEIPFLAGVCAQQKAPYGAFVQVLRDLLPIARETAQESLFEVSPLLSKLLPELSSDRALPPMEPDQEKILIQSAITSLLLASTRRTGAVLVLEDWDLADPLSVETLNYLLRNAVDAPLLVVVASRAKEDIVAEAMELAPLQAKESEAMLSSMLGVNEIPSGFASQLHDLTGGNPQFLVNLLEHLLNKETLTKIKGRWNIPVTLSSEHLPSGLKGLLLARFDGLSPNALKLAELGANIGTSFGLKMATDLLGWDENSLFDALDELLQDRLFTSDEDGYAFASGEMREALYARLSEEERLNYHTAIADYLEPGLPDEPPLAAITSLAWHFLKSRHTEKAIRFAYRAALCNKDMFANEAASQLLEAALPMFDTLKDAAAWNPLRCDILYELAVAVGWQQKLDAMGQYLELALPLAVALDDQKRLLALWATQGLHRLKLQTGEKLEEATVICEKASRLAERLGDLPTQVRCTMNEARAYFYLGQNARAQEVFEAAVNLAKAADQPYWLARGLGFLGYLLATGGDETRREEGMRAMAEAIELQERIGDKFGLGFNYMVLSSAQLHFGRFQEAEATCIGHAKNTEELGAFDDYTVALLNQAIALLETGQLERSSEVAQACFETSTKINSKMALPISQALLATIAASKGELNLALSQIRAAEAKGRETNNYTFSYVIPYVVETLLQLGRLQEAMHAAQEARDLISSTGNTEIETRLWVSMGEIHARLGEEPAARSYFERALERAKAGEELHIQARAAKGLAWMDIESGQRESAEAHLEVALELARSLSLRLLEAECLLLAGQLAEGPVALAHYEKAYGAAESLNVPGLQALALYGQGKLTTEPEAGLALIKQAKSRLAVLLEQLSIEDADAYLSFMERARLQREELHAEEIEMTSPAAATLPGDASLEDRSAWLTSQIAAAAQAQKSESNRLESIAHEFNLLASSAGDSLRLQELELANRRMGQLLKFSLAVNNVTDLETVLEQAVDLIVEITAAERGFLLFFENGQIRSQVSRVNVDRKSPLDWQFSKSIVDKVLNTGEVVCVFDALSDTQFNQAQSVVDLNLRTVICVPMRIRGKMFGAIYVDRQSINENFTPEDLEMVMGLATQASGAIENARIHQEWVEKSKRLELLNTLSKTISTSLDMEEVLDLVLKMTLDVSRAERGFLFMLDETGRKLLCRGARDLKGPLRVDEDHEISQSICAKALASGEPISVADAMNDEEFQFNQSISALNLRMVMCVPMTVQGRVIGLLYVDSQAVVNAFGDKDLDLLSAIAGHASVAIDNAKLHTHVQKLADDLKRTFYSFVQALGASIDAKHPLTAGHSFRVTDYTVRLARRIGMSEDEIENLRIAGLLHDVGKIGTPDHILGKPGSFTLEEYEIMKKHVVHTREILDTIYFPESQGHIPAIAGAHHEKWDGTGYPNQLAGDDIPFGGRIMALGDVFDAITSKRDYREAMPLPQALDIIRKGSGSHFDPALAQAFVRMIEEEGVSGPDKEVVVSLAHAQEARLV